MKFSIEIDYIVNKEVHPLTTTPGFFISTFLKRAVSVVTVVVVTVFASTFKFSYAACFTLCIKFAFRVTTSILD